MSISLKFPDGAERSYDDGVTPLAVAEGISKSLAKKVVAAKIDGAAWDLTRPLEGGGKFELVMRDSPDGLEIIRHDAAHVITGPEALGYDEVAAIVGGVTGRTMRRRWR